MPAVVKRAAALAEERRKKQLLDVGPGISFWSLVPTTPC